MLDGVVDDPSWFAYVCALDECDDLLTDPTCWVKANPNLGTSVPARYLEEAVREARGMPAAEADVLRLNFCVWTDAKSAFIPAAACLACRTPMTEDALRPFPCVAGLDLGESDDMSALAVVWRLADDRYHLKAWLWTCEAAQRRYRARPYDVMRRCQPPRRSRPATCTTDAT